MTDQQQQAVEKAADDKCEELHDIVYDGRVIPQFTENMHQALFREGFVEGTKHIITNPSDFGLVSFEDLDSFYQWAFDCGFAIQNKIWFNAFRTDDKNNFTTAQLFEIYKAKTEQK